MRRVFGILEVVLFIGFTGAAQSADWSQWRGPNGNGSAPDGPPLIDSFPPEGPVKLWESEKIPDSAGGWGSVTVAEGGVYLYLNWKDKEPITTRTLTGDGLMSLGQPPADIPEDLIKSMEAARVSEERTKLEGEAEKKWREDWANANVPEEKKDLRPFVVDRLGRGEKALPLEVFAKLAPIKDKEFADQAELDKWFESNGIVGDLKNGIAGVIRSDKDVAQDVIFCFDRETGTTRWRVKFPGRPSRGSSSTPCVRNGRCYVLGSDANIYCVDAKTGGEVWRAKSKGNPAGEDASSFIIVDDLLILMAGPVTAYSIADGQPVWSVEGLKSAFNSATWWSKDGKNYLICNADAGVGCVDAKDGKLLWRVPGGGASTAAVEGDYMAVFSSRKEVGFSTYKMSVAGAETIAATGARDGGSSPILHNGYAYAVGGGGKARAVCISLSDGKIMWEEKLGVNAEYTSPVWADGKIITLAGSELAIIDARPEKFTLLCKADVKALPFTSPATADGKVYLRLNDRVACFDLRKNR